MRFPQLGACSCSNLGALDPGTYADNPPVPAQHQNQFWFRQGHVYLGGGAVPGLGPLSFDGLVTTALHSKGFRVQALIDRDDGGPPFDVKTGATPEPAQAVDRPLYRGDDWNTWGIATFEGASSWLDVPAEVAWIYDMTEAERLGAHKPAGSNGAAAAVPSPGKTSPLNGKPLVAIGLVGSALGLAWWLL